MQKLTRFTLSVPRIRCSIVLGAVLVGALTGCETVKTSPVRGGESIRSVAPVPSAREGSSSGVLIGVRFNDPDKSLKSSDCRLRVENQSTRKDAFVPLKPDEAGTYVSLEPGRYIARRLGCGLGKVWNLEDLYTEGFKVEPGRVSYLGKVLLNFKKGELETVRNASRIESAEALSVLLPRAPGGSEHNLISGFTGKAITREMIEGPKREGFDVFALGVNDPDRVLSPILESLKSCGTDETKRDPLRFGQLEYVSVYRQGRFVEFRDRADKNAFSDSFRSCIERALSEFRPDVPGEVRVRTRL